MALESWRAVIQYLPGSIALALPAPIWFRLRLNLATTTGLYLILFFLPSIHGSFFSSATRVEENE
jgi:hypothetical protein